MNVKKVATIAGVALVLFFLISQPGQSADFVKGILTMLKDGAMAIIDFVKQLAA